MAERIPPDHIEWTHKASAFTFGDLLAGLSGQDLKRRCTTPGGASIPVWKWLCAMVEHEAHDRGQIYLMLGMLGITTPPLYGLTEEEVRAASQE